MPSGLYPQLSKGKLLSLFHYLSIKFQLAQTIISILKGDAMNLTLIYNDVTSFPSWIRLTL